MSKPSHIIRVPQTYINSNGHGSSRHWATVELFDSGTIRIKSGVFSHSYKAHLDLPDDYIEEQYHMIQAKKLRKARIERKKAS